MVRLIPQLVSSRLSHRQTRRSQVSHRYTSHFIRMLAINEGISDIIRRCYGPRIVGSNKSSAQGNERCSNARHNFRAWATTTAYGDGEPDDKLDIERISHNVPKRTQKTGPIHLILRDCQEENATRNTKCDEKTLPAYHLAEYFDGLAAASRSRRI